MISLQKKAGCRRGDGINGTHTAKTPEPEKKNSGGLNQAVLGFCGVLTKGKGNAFIGYSERNVGV